MTRATTRARFALPAWVLAASALLVPARGTHAGSWRPVREGMREILGLASSGSTYVAVGSLGEIHTSPDGRSWTRSVSPSSLTLRDVAFGGGQFVAVGLCCASSVDADDAGAVLTSPDGVTWTQRFPGSSARGRDLFAVAFGGGVWVAVGSAGTVIRSTDGINWSSSASGTSSDLLGVAFGGGLFVAVGANRTVITSPNGTAWTVQPGVPLSSGTTLNSVAHNGSLFIAAGSAGGLITSPNGSVWTLRSVPTTASLTGVAATGSLAVAVGYDTILSSPTGTTWTARTFAATGPGVSRALRAVVSGPAGFLAGGSQGALFASADGISPWASRSVPSSRGIFAVAHDGAQYCAVGTSGAVARSPDGVTWTQGTGLSVVPAWPWAAIARGAGVFVAAGAGAEIMSSPNCVTWTERNAGRNADPATGITGDLRDVAFGNATFVAVGEEFPDPAPGIPLIATSPNGVSWTQRSSGLPTAVERSLATVGFGNGTFVALGTEWSTGASILLTSPTGVTWTSQSAPFDAFESFSDVTFANGLFVAVGDRIWTSPNGTAWTLRHGFSSTHFFGVSFGGGRFVAVGRLGVHLSSPDGVNWTPDSPASADSQHAVAFGANRFVSVGDSATTLLACLTPGPNPVVDSSFEGGTPNASWAEASTNFGTPLCDASCGVAGARTGSWWAWFGGVPSALEQGSLQQSVTIPSGSATLAFYLSIPASSGNGTDFVRALVDGNVVFTAFQGDARFTPGYARVDVDISCFADGGAHLLRFESTSAGTGPGTFSSFFVDDVSIESCSTTSRSFAIGDVALIEGNAGSRSALFTTFLSARDCRSHSVNFSTANGSATTGSDYASASGTLSFPPQALSRTITVQVNGDTGAEPDETFTVNLASPSGAVLEDSAGLGTILNDDTPIDLSITKTDGQTTVFAGTVTTYTITVTNAGPAAVTGATVTDTFPAAFTSVSWTCAASAGSSCGTPSGTGNTNQLVNLAVGGTVVLNADATLSGAATGSVSNTATVATPAGIVDPVPGNNSATDVDTVLPPGALVSAAKTVIGTFEAGGAITYTIVLTNDGIVTQGNNPGNEFTDTLPGTLSGVSAGASSGTVSTVGNTVTWNGSLAVSGSVTITINATINAGTQGAVISNQGTVNYDADNNNTNEASAPSDDPGQPGAADPTPLFVGSGAVDFFTLPPCRIVDTRNPAGPLGGPALAAQTSRTFTVTGGPCGIPPTAKAISVNLAVAQPTAGGNLRLRPGGMPVPLVSAINYGAGETRSNNAVLPLNASGQISVFCGQASGTVHFILDVNGYFE